MSLEIVINTGQYFISSCRFLIKWTRNYSTDTALAICYMWNIEETQTQCLETFVSFLKRVEFELLSIVQHSNCGLNANWSQSAFSKPKDHVLSAMGWPASVAVLNSTMVSRRKLQWKTLRIIRKTDQVTMQFALYHHFRLSKQFMYTMRSLYSKCYSTSIALSLPGRVTISSQEQQLFKISIAIPNTN